MKFGHELTVALEKEGFPKHWIDSAIPYKHLKKQIGKIELELQNLGLDPTTLAYLTCPEGQAYSDSQKVALHYNFAGEKQFSPKLILSLRVEDGIEVLDATLSSDTRTFLQKLVSKNREESMVTLDGSCDSVVKEIIDVADSKVSPSNAEPANGIEYLEVPLRFDAEFFKLLEGTKLARIQVAEEARLTSEIKNVSTEVRELVKRPIFGKSDLYRWRQLFEIYLEAAPFFSVRESDRSRRNSTAAAKQLQWFQAEVSKRGIVDNFKLPASRLALNRFVEINIALLKSLTFQEINQKALTKILKKFDKRTQLGATQTFPMITHSETMIMSETMSRAVCQQMTTDIVSKVPQVDDYLCPICLKLEWRPVRLRCKHIFCLSCSLHMQKEKTKFCPLCRERTVMEADIDNLDPPLEKWLRKNFPKEVKEREREIEADDRFDTWGIETVTPEPSRGRDGGCVIM